MPGRSRSGPRLAQRPPRLRQGSAAPVSPRAGIPGAGHAPRRAEHAALEGEPRLVGRPQPAPPRRRLRPRSRVPPRRIRPLAGSRRALRSGRGARSNPSSLVRGPPRRAPGRAGRSRTLPPRRGAAGRLRRPGWCRSLRRGPGGGPDAQCAHQPRSSHRARSPGHHESSGRGLAKDAARPGVLPRRAISRGSRSPGGAGPRWPQPRGADPGDGPLAARREGRGSPGARHRRRTVRILVPRSFGRRPGHAGDLVVRRPAARRPAPGGPCAHRRQDARRQGRVGEGPGRAGPPDRRPRIADLGPRRGRPARAGGRRLPRCAGRPADRAGPESGGRTGAGRDDRGPDRSAPDVGRSRDPARRGRRAGPGGDRLRPRARADARGLRHLGIAGINLHPDGGVSGGVRPAPRAAAVGCPALVRPRRAPPGAARVPSGGRRLCSRRRAARHDRVRLHLRHRAPAGGRRVTLSRLRDLAGPPARRVERAVHAVRPRAPGGAGRSPRHPAGSPGGVGQSRGGGATAIRLVRPHPGHGSPAPATTRRRRNPSSYRGRSDGPAAGRRSTISSRP